MPNLSLELWSDSFHEGDWACEQLCIVAKSNGGRHNKEYIHGFIPHYIINTDIWSVDIKVYGSYKSWSPVPVKISDLLSWGKPDFILYNPESDNIIFAVEETAAVPTGNQALQRCERLYGSARSKIPFWYLLSEFGQHRDGGTRRDSIWPTIMALKLSLLNSTPCVVLHYSDLDNPEDYSAGFGLKSLFNSLYKMIENHVTDARPLEEMAPILETQYKEMINFISSQWQNVTDFLPGFESFSDDSLANHFARAATDNTLSNNYALPNNFLIWPKCSELPISIKDKQVAKELIKHDNLSYLLEKDVGYGKAYCLSNNAGSKPQPKKSLKEWIEQQRILFEKGKHLVDQAKFSLNINDFPSSKGGSYHITTSKNIVYLYDKWSDLKKSIENAFPRLKNKDWKIRDEQTVLCYISNSMKPGRIFGDPFTGQIAAFATCFGKLDPTPRVLLAYFPHQVHTQVDLESINQKNKGLTLMQELTDYIIFHEGVAINLKQKIIL